MKLKRETSNFIYNVITILAALGAIDTAIYGIFKIDMISNLTKDIDDLPNFLYYSIGFCGIYLLIVKSKYLLRNYRKFKLMKWFYIYENIKNIFK